ncbi:RagB/SusD family nutrient uptake outer membrane protein, partial [Arachidicoccus sp.]|uniref:RagB/SusD family nutrient uptake outer membrane protein n=1 Tax=Arachidicoccus sp. TaxID=1872624 RepID=UPI003D23EB7F
IFAGSESTYWGFPTMLITAWSSLYKMVSAANILYAKVDEVPDPAFSESARKKYKAEAVYLRSLAYFYLVRLFGDVPYYTDAYNATSLPKTNQVTIFQNCVNDLGAVVGDLPWTYTDPANIAVRAMRGSALIVMMEMNMWMAGFDNANKLQYWTSTDSLGKELINDNQGAYALLPIDKYPVIFRGKSKEGLVELSQNANYGESGYGFDGRNYNISGYASHNPPGSTSGYSYSYIGSDYMSKLYPQADPDRRKDLWFPTQYIYSGNQMFEFYKYYDFSQAANGSYPIGSLMILRYADAFLLRAEALDDLGQEDEATEMLNMIRQRAGAKLYTSSDDQSLSDAIWYERVKEFMGEGTYFFDLVRTGKILDAKYCPYPIEVEAFYKGAWTWPIPSDAQANNPYLSLNGYWN